MVLGFALILDNQVLHVSLFAKENGDDDKPYRLRMQRHSQRKRNKRFIL